MWRRSINLPGYACPFF